MNCAWTGKIVTPPPTAVTAVMAVMAVMAVTVPVGEATSWTMAAAS